MSSHPAPVFPPVVVVVPDRSGESCRVFGPFADDETGREWAERAFPKHAWTTQDLDLPFTPLD